MNVDERYIKNDIMRYKNNSLSSTLAILSILFNVFFFVSIYKSDASAYYHKWFIGVSILYNLIFLLSAFLSSEGVKNYKKAFAYVLIVIGILQFVRIGIIPVNAHFKDIVTVQGVERAAMLTPQFVRTVIYLCVSGGCAIASGIVCIIKAITLNNHIASLAKQEA